MVQIRRTETGTDLVDTPVDGVRHARWQGGKVQFPGGWRKGEDLVIAEEEVLVLRMCW